MKNKPWLNDLGTQAETLSPRMTMIRAAIIKAANKALMIFGLLAMVFAVLMTYFPIPAFSWIVAGSIIICIVSGVILLLNPTG